MNTYEELKSFFEPKTIAVIGASKSPSKGGYIVVENLTNYKKGKIYPINPNVDKILGLETYPTVLDVPDEIDLAAIIIPAENVPKVLWECSQKRVKAAVILSQGFSEAGEKGKILQNEVDKVIRKGGIRVIGPNSVGLINTSNNLVVSFVPFKEFRRGNVSIVSQTGIFCGNMLLWFLSFEWFGLAKSIDLGNKCDVDDDEILMYLEEDPETKIVLLHMEGVRDGKKFLKTAKKVSKSKPILCLKGGKTWAGARAVASHTGSIAGVDQIYDAAFKQAGIVRVESLNDFLDLTQAFNFSVLPKGNRVAILSVSGGVAAVLLDLCVEKGLQPAEFSSQTVEKLRKIFPPYVNISNPVDLWPSIMSFGAKKVYPEILETVLRDPKVDMVIVFTLLSEKFLESWSFKPEFILESVRGKVDKPVAITAMGEALSLEKLNRITGFFHEKGVLFYWSLESSVKALAALYKYAKYKEKILGLDG